MASTNHLSSKTAQAMLARAFEGIGRTGRNKRRILVTLAARDGKCCHWCHEPVRFQWEPGMDEHQRHVATFDHIKTAVAGGGRKLSNGVLACRRCNNLRGSMKYSTFQKQLKKRDLTKWTESYYSKNEQKAAKKQAYIDRQARELAARKAWVNRAYKLRWYHWALRELSEWGQALHLIGVAF